MKVCTDCCLFGAWVAACIEQKIINARTILDVGTGTGLLSLMLAQKSQATIDAIDIDKKSFVQASENFDASPWQKRLRAFHSGIQEWKPSYRYDLIIANPPFFENDLLPEEHGKSISKHSVTMNLAGLLLEVKNLLKDDGNLALLIPWVRTGWLENEASRYSLFLENKTKVKQTTSHNYFRAMLLFQNDNKTITHENELAIKNNNTYTPEFIELLKDYYLQL